MKTRHLCARHRLVIQQSSEQTNRLWWGAYNMGVTAYRTGNWERAERFLGAAYEIALARFAMDIQAGHCCLSANQFAAIGRYYANVLCQLQDFDAAETCLRRIHDGLLHRSEESQLPYLERVAAFEQLAEFRQKLVALLTLSGKESVAKCTDLISRQLAKQAVATLCH